MLPKPLFRWSALWAVGTISSVGSYSIKKEYPVALNWNKGHLLEKRRLATPVSLTKPILINSSGGGFLISIFPMIIRDECDTDCTLEISTSITFIFVLKLKLKKTTPNIQVQIRLIIFPSEKAENMKITCWCKLPIYYDLFLLHMCNTVNLLWVKWNNLVNITHGLQPLTADESIVTSYGTHWGVLPPADM